MLEIEARAARLELDQEDILLGIRRRKVARLDGRIAFLHRHATVVLEHGADKGECLEEISKHFHLLVELAEDDPAIALAGLVALAKEVANLVELAADLGKLGARPPEGLLLARLDVDLGVHADLAKAEEDAEHGQHVGTTLKSLGLAPLALNVVVNTRIDLRLVLASEVEVTVFNDGLRRHGKASRRLAAVNRASKIAVADPILVIRAPLAGTSDNLVKADKLQIRDDIVHAIDDRSCGKSPLVLGGNLEHGECLLCAGIADGLGLVQNHAVVLLALAQHGLIGNLVVVGDVNDRATKTRIHGTGPLATPLLGYKEVDVAALGGILPLLLDGKGGDDKGLHGVRTVDDKAERLEGLAEPHLVAEDTAANDNLGVLGYRIAFDLLLQHPVDTSLLVGGIACAVPNGVECGHLIALVGYKFKVLVQCQFY